MRILRVSPRDATACSAPVLTVAPWNAHTSHPEPATRERPLLASDAPTVSFLANPSRSCWRASVACTCSRSAVAACTGGSADIQYQKTSFNGRLRHGVGARSHTHTHVHAALVHMRMPRGMGWTRADASFPLPPAITPASFFHCGRSSSSSTRTVSDRKPFTRATPVVQTSCMCSAAAALHASKDAAAMGLAGHSKPACENPSRPSASFD